MSDQQQQPHGAIFLTGGNGFLGSHVAREALADGWRVRALVRPGSDRSLLNPLRGDALDLIEGQLTDPAEALASHMAGACVVIHCAAATSEHTNDYALSRRINVEATRTLGEAARQAGIERFVFVSSQSAHEANHSPYGRTKLEAEATLLATGVETVILRPGVIYGPEDRGIFAKMERTLRSLPVVPVIGSGRYLQYPVHVQDVARACLQAAMAPGAAGRAYGLPGADAIAFIDLLRLLLSELGLRRPLVPLPVWMCRIIATVGERLMPRPPITHSNIEGLLTAPPLDATPAMRDFGYAPRTLAQGRADVLAARSRSRTK